MNMEKTAFWSISKMLRTDELMLSAEEKFLQWVGNYVRKSLKPLLTRNVHYCVKTFWIHKLNGNKKNLKQRSSVNSTYIYPYSNTESGSTSQYGITIFVMEIRCPLWWICLATACWMLLNLKRKKENTGAYLPIIRKENICNWYYQLTKAKEVTL